MKTQKLVSLSLLVLFAVEAGLAQAPRMEAKPGMFRPGGQDEQRGTRYRKAQDLGPEALIEYNEKLPPQVKLAGPVRRRSGDSTDLELVDTVVVANPPMFGLASSYVETERGANASLLTFPVQGSTLTSPQTFSWNAAGSGWYWLWVGSCQDCADIADWDLGGNRSTAVNLPTDGRAIYVTLFTFSQGLWYWGDYRFQAPGGRFSAPQISSPTEGSTLFSTQTFRWTPGSGIAEYYLWAGSCLNCSDIFDGSTGRDTTANIRIPASGKPVFLTLWFLVNGEWYYRDYQFRAPSAADTGGTKRNVRVEVTNRLWYAINISVNGREVGVVPANDTRTHEEPMTSLELGWEMVRPTLSGRALGDAVSGSFDKVVSPSGTIRFEVNNRFRDGSGIFMPRIGNRTGTALSLEVNGGLGAANRCNCTIPANRDNVAAGYYRLFSNSNVRLFGRSDYTGAYTYWGTDNGRTPSSTIPDMLRDTSGRLDLVVTTTPR